MKFSKRCDLFFVCMIGIFIQQMLIKYLSWKKLKKLVFTFRNIKNQVGETT
jgi:hypothetical protein